jgi:glycosyltransferase involved in cell wall biosynthesis
MRILVLAYACEPHKGSEPAVGWMWCRLLARFGEVTVITRANNQDAIESASSIPEVSQLHFEYVDLPDWARKWKRGPRGTRLYYVLWQFAAMRRARFLLSKTRFDLAWHVTLANAWFGSTLCFLPTPYVFGPVSGGVPSCWRISLVGARGLFSEVSRSLARTLARQINPLARFSWTRAELILTNNDDTLRWLPRRHHSKSEVFPNVILDVETSSRRPIPGSTRKVLYAGYLLPLKGLSLALRTMTYLEGWRLDIYGDGPDRARLETIARASGVADRVRFLGWVPRERLFEAMTQEADVLLFPSLHDEVGWVVAEALAHGLPVVCLDRGGPKSLGGIAVKLGRFEETAQSLAQEVKRASLVSSPNWGLSSRFESLRSLVERRNLAPSALWRAGD